MVVVRTSKCLIMRQTRPRLSSLKENERERDLKSISFSHGSLCISLTIGDGWKSALGSINLPEKERKWNGYNMIQLYLIWNALSKHIFNTFALRPLFIKEGGYKWAYRLFKSNPEMLSYWVNINGYFDWDSNREHPGFFLRIVKNWLKY